MGRSLLLLFFFLVSACCVSAQESFEAAVSAGPVFTSPISYQNSTGHINSSIAPSVIFKYYPCSSWNFQISYSEFTPTTFLENANNNSVAVYTRSAINMQRFLGGINYSFLLKNIHPYIGCLFGFTRAATTQLMQYPSSYTSFSWAYQAGVNYYFCSFLGLGFNAMIINTPDVPNNSSYFNVDKTGAGFPDFAVGNSSNANIFQWNISIGLIARLKKKKR